MPSDPHKKVPDLPDVSSAPLIGAALTRIVASNKDTENDRGVAVSRAERPKRRIDDLGTARAKTQWALDTRLRAR